MQRVRPVPPSPYVHPAPRSDFLTPLVLSEQATLWSNPFPLIHLESLAVALTRRLWIAPHRPHDRPALHVDLPVDGEPVTLVERDIALLR